MTGTQPVRIIVFAKAPQPGFAKTRLIPTLGPQGAATLARRMLDTTLVNAVAAAVGPVELCTTPLFSDSAWRGVTVAAEVHISDQGDGDLGMRMSRAARRACERGAAAVLIGTDGPDMTPVILRNAARALRTFDAVIHPGSDGGYVLLGLARFAPGVFSAIAWSTDDVAAATIERIRALGWRLHVGATMHDVDVAADLRHLSGTAFAFDRPDP